MHDVLQERVDDSETVLTIVTMEVLCTATRFLSLSPRRLLRPPMEMHNTFQS